MFAQAQGHNFSYPQNLSSRPDPYSSNPRSAFDPDQPQHNNSSPSVNGDQDFDHDFDDLYHARGSRLSDQQERPPEQSDYPWPRFPGELGRSDSEADSLIDLYRQQKSSTAVASSSHTSKSMDPRTPSREDPDNSRWIHRDKLTMIEIKEYRDRGIEPPPELLERAGMAVDGGKDVKGYGTNAQAERGEYPKKSTSLSSHPYSDGEFDGTDDTKDEGFVPHDPRSPEEIAADQYEHSPPQTGYHSSSLRSGSSRIPLSVSSPAPVPVEHLERSTPLPRKRGASGHWDEDALRYPKSRSRSQSAGSQVLLDDPEHTGHISSGSWSMQSSPTKAVPSNKIQTPPTAKKTSATPRNVSSTKQRATSANSRHSPAQRPGTRSGPDGRPSTAVNRPEGDPPWLQDMYKPDPSLPPDQQMLPTHAKRLRQEQWEKEGKAGSAFDRDFTPVAVHPDATGSRNTQSGNLAPPVEAPKESNGEPGWPLKPVTSNGPSRSPSIENAGYKTMPKIQSPPAIGAMSSPKLHQSEHSPHLEPMNVEEGKKEDNGCCGGCVVM